MSRRIAVTALAVALLAGCATQSTYQPATKRGAEGYTETKLSANRYRVTFTGNPVTPSETVKDYALLRAAELTLQEGFDWFQISNSDVDKKTTSTVVGSDFGDPGQTTVYQRCGLLSCDSYVSHSPGFSTGVSSVSQSTAYSSAIEVVMGKKPMPKSVESYNAQELASTLRRLMGRP